MVDNVEMAECGRLFNTNSDAVSIKGNYIHHNRHVAGGYGIEVAAGADALIEQNVFDENCHAIAGQSRRVNARDYSGCTARDNLILAGGGLHCSTAWWQGIFGWTLNFSHTQQIDMHGDENPGHWDCGTAGESIIIERNTILYTARYAIKIRGNPVDEAVVDRNVFAHESRKDAIAQNGSRGIFGDNISNPIDFRGNNVFDVNPFNVLGSCDFSGDGQLDDFMATGVTWWARSPMTHQWRYLNTMDVELPQLEPMDLDEDALCDVVLKRAPGLPVTYSKSGTSPWEPLQ